MKKRLTLFLACLFLGIGMALAQTQATGTVISSEDGQPVIGAAVKDASGKTVGVTDVNGNFKANVPAGSTLTISCMGMEPINVKAGSNVRVTMSPDSKALDEVMVVAFGTEKKSAFTGSAKVIGSEELQQSQVSSITDALAGQVAGLQMRSSSGAPGSTQTLRIRGFSSINAGNDPLIVVDGAPYSGDLNNLNPNDVESMTVLKDAASTALYGARGANGVIIITTKNAKKGQDARITFDAKFGWNTRALQRYDVVKSPAKYYEMQYEAVKNYYKSTGMDDNAAWQAANAALMGSDMSVGSLGYDMWSIPEGEMLIGSNGRMNPNATLGKVVNYNGEDYLLTPDDWTEVGTRTGHRQEYNLSINGATDRSSYLASVGYLKNEGIAVKSNMERFTGRLRADYQAKSWLKTGANLSFAHFKYNSLGNNGSSSSTGNLFAFTEQMAPIYPAYVRNADGSIKVDDNGIKIMDYGQGMNAGGTRPFITDANPIQDAKLNTRMSEGNSATGNGFMDITFMPGLKLTINGTYNLDETRGTYVYNPYYGQFDSTGGTVSKYHSRSYDVDFQQLLNYTTTIKDVHNITAMIGHEYYNYKYYYLGASKSKMFSQTNKELEGAVVDGQSADSYTSRYNNEGYIARLLYDYDMKYFGSAYFRRDASSRFHPDHRWGNFWALGGAWLISKENWFKADWVDELKFKISLGSQGNDNISNYLYTDRFTVSNSDGEVGVSFYGKGNEDITWETNTNFNMGFEFALFRNKLTGSLEFYKRNTTDMLFAFSVAPSLGYTSIYKNIGDMYNSGFELDLQYNVIRNKNVNWDIHLNAATVRNRITKLDDDLMNTTYYDFDGKEYKGFVSSGFISEGLSRYTYRMKKYAGVDSETGLSMWYYDEVEKDDDGKETRVHKTTTEWNNADYYVIKDKTGIPDLFGGFGTSVQAYGFDFAINFSYQIGGYMEDGTYEQFMASPTSGSAGYNFHKDLLKSWTAENANSNVPRFQFGDIYSSASSTRFLTNASYLNCENINFGYTLPQSLTRRAAIEKLRLYLACENVFYISKRKGFDPRQGFYGTTNATYYAPIRTFSIGASITF